MVGAGMSDSSRLPNRLTDDALEVTLAIMVERVVPGAGIVLDRLLTRYKRRLYEAGDALATTVNDLELLRRRLEEDEAIADLFASLVDIATRTRVQAKRRLAGIAVGRAVLDDAEIDNSELLHRVLRDLDVVHFRAMEAIARKRREFAGDLPSRPELRITQPADQQVAALVESYPAPIRATLVAHGLVERSSTYNG